MQLNKLEIAKAQIDQAVSIKNSVNVVSCVHPCLLSFSVDVKNYEFYFLCGNKKYCENNFIHTVFISMDKFRDFSLFWIH